VSERPAPRSVAIVQARMGSTRLPGKVLLDLAGEPVLVRTVERTRRAETLDEVVIATTTAPADDALADFCAERGWPCERGDENDLLDRYYHAASAHDADLVVRITSDCPFMDPALIDRVVRAFLANQPADYASNTKIPPSTYPPGMDVEVMWFDALARAWREDDDPAWREHVTPYLYRHPELFGLLRVPGEIDLSGYRWTVDTPEDLAFCERIYQHFGHDRFTTADVYAALLDHPEWIAINQHVEQKQVD
jgi:spore coat polysaccharide biosynthesis protein SpsF